MLLLIFACLSSSILGIANVNGQEAESAAIRIFTYDGTEYTQRTSRTKDPMSKIVHISKQGISDEAIIVLETEKGEHTFIDITTGKCVILPMSLTILRFRNLIVKDVDVEDKKVSGNRIIRVRHENEALSADDLDEMTDVLGVKMCRKRGLKIYRGRIADNLDINLENGPLTFEAGCVMISTDVRRRHRRAITGSATHSNSKDGSHSTSGSAGHGNKDASSQSGGELTAVAPTRKLHRPLRIMKVTEATVVVAVVVAVAVAERKAVAIKAVVVEVVAVEVVAVEEVAGNDASSS